MQSRHSPNPSSKTELRRVPGGSTRSRLFGICPLCSFLTLRALGGPHAPSSLDLQHEYLHSSGWILVQDQGFARQGCGTSTTLLLWWCTAVSMCCHSATQKGALKIKGRFPRPRRILPAQHLGTCRDHEPQRPSVHKHSKRHFAFCTQCTCASGSPQHFTAELFSPLC